MASDSVRTAASDQVPSFPLRPRERCPPPSEAPISTSVSTLDVGHLRRVRLCSGWTLLPIFWHLLTMPVSLSLKGRWKEAPSQRCKEGGACSGRRRSTTQTDARPRRASNQHPPLALPSVMTLVVFFSLWGVFPPLLLCVSSSPCRSLAPPLCMCFLNGGSSVRVCGAWVGHYPTEEHKKLWRMRRG